MNEADRAYQILRLFVVAEPSDKPGERVSYTIAQDLDDNHPRARRGKKIRVDRREKFRMKFILCDSTGLALRFADKDDDYTGPDQDQQGPFWVVDGPGCPPSRGDRKNFKVERKDDQRIVVTNHNKDEADYQFKLRIFAGDSTEESFDPVISNGGGGHRGGGVALAAAALLGLCAVVGAAYFVGLFD